MSAAALALVLVAALLHAAWNLVAKKAGGDSRFVLLFALMSAVLWAPVGAWAGWPAVPQWRAREWALVAASGALHVLYFAALLRGYRSSELTVVYPVARGTGPLVSAFGALALLGETMSAAGAAGVCAVAGGIVLVAGGPRLWSAARGAEQRERVARGIAWGAATGLFIAGYTLVDGYAVKVARMSPILVDYFGNLARIAFLLPLAARDFGGFAAAARAQWRAALVVALLGPLAYVLVLYAMTLAPLSHVAPAREVSLLFAALLGGRLLGEGDRLLRLAGALCIAGGVAALALS